MSKTVLILTAMGEEFNAVSKSINHPSEEIVISEKFKKKVKLFQRGEDQFLLGLSGVASVNAAVTLSMVIEKYSLDAVFLLGVGGSVSAHLDIGDLVVSTKIWQHDYYSSLDQGIFHARPGQYILSESDVKKQIPLIDASEKLRTLVMNTELSCQKLEGVIASGNEFVATVERKNIIRNSIYGPDLVEMEGAGIAQICSQFKIPFVVTKTVSDRLNPNGGIDVDFIRFLKQASENAGKVGLHIFENY